MKNSKSSAFIAALTCLCLASSMAFAQQPARKNFGKGNPFTVGELPEGKLKAKLQTLDPQTREKAMKWLHALSFHAFDAAEHLRVDHKGGIFIVCPDGHGNCDGKKHKHSETESLTQEISTPEQIDEPPTETPPPTVESAAVPVSSPPIYNSKPGATRHIYLDFNGAIVSGKSWSETDDNGTPLNTSDDTTWNSWDCHAWSIDADRATFSDTEQTKIQQMWQRISEDYAPFDVNVTTDVTYDPATYTGDKNKVGWLLFTPRTDKLSARCPHYGSGGVAYTGVYGDGNFFAAYQPAWVTGETSTSASDMAEAASHEMGHNMGLTHDGRSSPAEEYYGGHAGAPPSWGPIMGTGYGRNLSQWSKGEYYNANQTQDDLLIISGRVPYRSDDHGNTPGTSTVLLSSTVNQSGIIERTNDADYFVFSTGAGTLTFNSNTYRCVAETWGANLDVLLELYNSSNVLVASNNPAAEVNASISYAAAAGTYYLVVKPSGAGTPLSASPSGYAVYGSLGQYTITGTYIPTDTLFIASPIGGETMLKSTIQEIRWLSGMGGNVKIELFKGGVLNSTIAASTTNDGSFNWTVPKTQTAGVDYKIKITSIETPAKFDQSATNFTIATPSNSILDANMDTNPGFTTTGLFEYGVPVSPNKVLSAHTGTNIYDTDLKDTCTTGSTLTTKSLDCSNHIGVSLDFWYHAYTFSTIKFEVSNDNVNWIELFTDTNTTINNWIHKNYDISAVADGQRTVYIRWSLIGTNTYYGGDGLAIDDVQVVGQFVPADDIYLVTPNGGESWTRQIPKQINWTSGIGGDVKIELYKAGFLNTTIASSAPNDGSYTVVLPSSITAAADYRIKITSLLQPSVSATSAANFSVVAPSSNIFNTNLDTDPGFTTTGLFEFGAPSGVNKPTAAKTGTNIYDTDLDGTCFTSSNLTSTPINCSDHTAVNLEFWACAYMVNTWTFKFEVSNDNTNWTQLFSQAGSTNTAWVKYTYNISAIADGKPTVYIRWSMTGSGSQYSGSGLGIDDISVTGTFTPTQFSYPVSYNSNGSTSGTPPVDQIKTDNIGLSLATNSGNLARTNYTFAGWSTAADGTGTIYNPGDVYIANSALVLYAKWTITLSNWAASNSLTGGNADAGANPDGDSLKNIQEYAFGMNPNSSTMPSLTFIVAGEVTQAGIPVLRYASSKYHAVFARRKDYVAAGLTYTVQFSADLKAWTPSSAGLGILTGAGSSELEAVSIEFPTTVPVDGGGAEQAPKFFRVGVEEN
ncbi:MAG: InlB B-repeat-containing protein [Verrucomicrobiota bacterium]